MFGRDEEPLFSSHFLQINDPFANIQRTEFSTGAICASMDLHTFGTYLRRSPDRLASVESRYDNSAKQVHKSIFQTGTLLYESSNPALALLRYGSFLYP